MPTSSWADVPQARLERALERAPLGLGAARAGRKAAMRLRAGRGAGGKASGSREGSPPTAASGPRAGPAAPAAPRANSPARRARPRGGDDLLADPRRETRLYPRPIRPQLRVERGVELGLLGRRAHHQRGHQVVGHKGRVLERDGPRMEKAWRALSPRQFRILAFRVRARSLAMAMLQYGSTPAEDASAPAPAGRAESRPGAEHRSDDAAQVATATLSGRARRTSLRTVASCLRLRADARGRIPRARPGARGPRGSRAWQDASPDGARDPGRAGGPPRYEMKRRGAGDDDERRRGGGYVEAGRPSQTGRRPTSPPREALSPARRRGLRDVVCPTPTVMFEPTPEPTHTSHCRRRRNPTIEPSPCSCRRRRRRTSRRRRPTKPPTYAPVAFPTYTAPSRPTPEPTLPRLEPGRGRPPQSVPQFCQSRRRTAPTNSRIFPTRSHAYRRSEARRGRPSRADHLAEPRADVDADAADAQAEPSPTAKPTKPPTPRADAQAGTPKPLRNRMRKGRAGGHERSERSSRCLPATEAWEKRKRDHGRAQEQTGRSLDDAAHAPA